MKDVQNTEASNRSADWGIWHITRPPAYEPTPIEMSAVRAFAKKYGRNWKNRLRLGWVRGDMRFKGGSFRHAVILKNYRFEQDSSLHNWLFFAPVTFAD
jgi:hypothetical protein